MRTDLLARLLTIAAVCLLLPGRAGADCLACHGDAAAVGAQLAIDPAIFDSTAHAGVGCPTCHSSVTSGHPDDGAPPNKADCAACHSDIAAAYRQSSHGANATCSDCHNPHRVRGPTALSGSDLNQACIGCHDPASLGVVHSDWLPQSALHLSALPCVSCHTAARDNVVTLYLVRYPASARHAAPVPVSAAELRLLSRDGRGESLLDRDGDKRISIAELRRFNQSPPQPGLRLLGMMTPESVTHDFGILANRRDCSFCHASGPAARQTSFLALANDDGSFRRVPVETGAVLDALYGTPDFYMVGATRSPVLNYIGAALVAGGLIVPVGHGTLRFFTRRNRTHREE